MSFHSVLKDNLAGNRICSSQVLVCLFVFYQFFKYFILLFFFQEWCLGSMIQSLSLFSYIRVFFFSFFLLLISELFPSSLAFLQFEWRESRRERERGERDRKEERESWCVLLTVSLDVCIYVRYLTLVLGHCQSLMLQFFSVPSCYTHDT